MGWSAIVVLLLCTVTTVSTSIACSALSMVAEKEDVPALRELLLAGTTGVAEALGVLQRRGIDEAAGRWTVRD